MAILDKHVKNTNRMMTAIQPLADGIAVVFADGLTGTIPFRELPEVGKLDNLDSVELRNPYELVVKTHQGETLELPWDFARHFCDPSYQPRVEVLTTAGRVSLGQRIRRLRRGMRTSQKALASAAGIGRVTLVRIEKGEQTPRFETLVALARALAVPLGQLLVPLESTPTGMSEPQQGAQPLRSLHPRRIAARERSVASNRPARSASQTDDQDSGAVHLGDSKLPPGTLRRLERLRSGNSETFVDYIRQVHAALGTQAAIRAAKMSGIFVDTYGTDRYERLAEQVLHLFEELGLSGNPDIIQLHNDSILLKRLFQALFDVRAGSEHGQPADRTASAAFLIATDVWIAGAQMLFATRDVGAVARTYPFIAIPVLPGNIDLTNALGEYSRQAEALAEGASIVYRYLVRRHGLPSLSDEVDENLIRSAREHIFLLDRWVYFCALTEFWQYFGAHLEHSNDVIRFVVDDHATFEERYISKKRADVNRIASAFAVWEKIPIEAVDPKTVELPPRGFRSRLELISTFFCLDIFGDASIGRECFGATLASWVRAYHLIAEFCSQILRERTGPTPFKLSQWCVVKSEAEWCALLVSGGITSDSAQQLVNALKFSEGSADFLDCPLIPVDDKLCVIPSIGATISPVHAMLSNFSRLGANINFKGAGLEDDIRSAVRSQGVRCESILASRDKSTYEVDAAFELDGDTYLVEVKTVLQPSDHRGHYLLRERLVDFASQHNRTCDFFQEHTDYLRDALDLPEGWEPKRIVRLIVCSAMLGAPVEVAGCQVVDASAFERFWHREPLTITSGDRALVVGGQETHTGPVSSAKLQAIIKSPPQISATRDALRRHAIVDDLGPVRFEVPRISSALDPIAIEGSEQFRIFDELMDQSEPFSTEDKNATTGADWT